MEDKAEWKRENGKIQVQTWIIVDAKIHIVKKKTGMTAVDQCKKHFKPLISPALPEQCCFFF